MVLSAFREENLAKIEEENDNKFECSLAKSERKREKVEKLLKRMFETVKELFLKNWNTMFDWSKNRFDQSNQAEAHRIFKTKFRLIEN